MSLLENYRKKKELEEQQQVETPAANPVAQDAVNIVSSVMNRPVSPDGVAKVENKFGIPENVKSLLIRAHKGETILPTELVGVEPKFQQAIKSQQQQQVSRVSEQEEPKENGLSVQSAMSKIEDVNRTREEFTTDLLKGAGRGALEIAQEGSQLVRPVAETVKEFTTKPLGEAILGEEEYARREDVKATNEQKIDEALNQLLAEDEQTIAGVIGEHIPGLLVGGGGAKAAGTIAKDVLRAVMPKLPKLLATAGISAAEFAGFTGAETLAKGETPSAGELGTAAAIGAAMPTAFKAVKGALSALPKETVDLFKIATGKMTGDIRKKTTEITGNLFKDTITKDAEVKAAAQRVKDYSSALLKRFGKQEEVIGEKLVADFSGTKFAKNTPYKYAVDTLLNSTEESIGRDFLARNAIKISDMAPTSGVSAKAARDLRKFIMENTSPEFAKLSDEYAELNAALEAISAGANPVRTVKAMSKLSPEIAQEVNAVKSLKGEQQPFVEAIIKSLDTVGSQMENEINKLSGQAVSGAEFRSGLESFLGKQGVNLTKEQVTQTNNKELFQIIAENQDDPIVQQLVKDRDLARFYDPNSAETQLRNIIVDKKNNINIKSMRDLLTQDSPSEAGLLLKELIPEELQKKIISSQFSAKQIKTIAELALLGLGGYRLLRGGDIIMNLAGN